MFTQRINRDDPERIDMMVTNKQGATITTGFAVAFTTTSGSNDGNEAVLPAASNLFTFAGIALFDIPNNEARGRVRAYGFVDSVRIYAHGTSVTIGAGVVMGPAAGSQGVSSTGALDTFGPVIAMEAIGAAVTSPGGWAKGFVRAV